jgi:hypothetical protein
LRHRIQTPLLGRLSEQRLERFILRINRALILGKEAQMANKEQGKNKEKKKKKQEKPKPPPKK